MHPLHDYVATKLAEQIKSDRVVVWYDERREFQPFVDELRGAPRTSSEPVKVSVGVFAVWLAEYAGSMFELRAVIEPHVCGDTPECALLYLPGCAHDRHGSVLMELEKGGTTWQRQLKQLAKQVLLKRYTLGDVDEMLPFDRKVSYADIARAASGSSGSSPPSILKNIFHDVVGNDAILATWLSSDARDEDIASKEATGELRKLVRARLGLELADGAPVAKLRAATLRFVLGGEFRLDLSCTPPSSLDGVPKPPTKDHESAVRDLARKLRTSFSAAYEDLANRVEQELGLAHAKLSPESLGSIDTFRFEEVALLRHAGDLITQAKFDEALAVVAAREQSFWLDRDVARKAQWEAARRMAELGRVAVNVRAEARKMTGDASAWIAAYTSPDSGWYRLDQAQRRLEAWRANLDDDPAEHPLAVARRAYEDACNTMAEGFTRALMKAGWSIHDALHQTRIFSEVVSSTPKPVAYFLVDAMRYEMGVELAEGLPKTSEVAVRHAVGALPSITPIGMAALLPGASASFSVAEEDGELGARIEDTFLPGLPQRKKHAAARIPGLVDLTLNELLSDSPSKLTRKVDGAQVIIVRSQEIDHAGEKGFSFSARQVMDTIIGNLARALRRLAAAGVENAVVTADHGHLFFAADRDDSMKIDSPGGNKIDPHRRCWIGRGGSTPAGCVRVAASGLGYASDLEFVFPIGSGVFRAGGDLKFHHGGPSLQEMVLPVIAVRTKLRDSSRPSAGPITASGLPPEVTNRIFSITLSFGGKQMMLGANSILVRPLLMAGGKQVGAVGMAVDAELDRATGCVRLEPNKPVTIAFILNDESAASIRVVVQDPTTDGELYRSPNDIPVRLGV